MNKMWLHHNISVDCEQEIQHWKQFQKLNWLCGNLLNGFQVKFEPCKQIVEQNICETLLNLMQLFQLQTINIKNVFYPLSQEVCSKQNITTQTYFLYML